MVCTSCCSSLDELPAAVDAGGRAGQVRGGRERRACGAGPAGGRVVISWTSRELGAAQVPGTVAGQHVAEDGAEDRHAG